MGRERLQALAFFSCVFAVREERLIFSRRWPLRGSKTQFSTKPVAVTRLFTPSFAFFMLNVSVLLIVRRVLQSLSGKFPERQRGD